VYASRPEAELVWVDRQGAIEPLGAGRGDFMYVRLSPDGSSLAYGAQDVGVLDLERGTRQRLNDDGSYPVWRPGTDEVSVFAIHNGLEQIFNVKADGSEEPYLLLEGEHPQYPAEWSRDGTTLLFNENHSETEHDLWIMREDGTTAPYLVTPAVEINARFSPDDKYVAYESEASGEVGVYVRDFPGGQRQWVVSSDGAREPVWSRDGKELFFKSGEDLVVVAVETEPEFRAGKPTRLFQAPNAWGRVSLYDVTPDGERFVMVRGVPAHFRELHVVLSWFDELNRLVPPS
jgi:Tol biopolymer transport system component